MRVVIDTNVLVSGIYDLDSPPGRLISAGVDGRIRLCAPEEVRVELVRVLKRVLGYSDPELRRTMAALPVDWIEKEVYEDLLEDARGLLRDPKDAPILALGLALDCDIVSGDRDLQVVQPKGIRVWKPAELAEKS